MLKTINLFFENFFSYSSPYVHFLLRFTLGISFFLHGYTKIPISQNFIGWLDSIGVIYAELTSYLIAWVEMLSGVGIIIGGLLVKTLPIFSNFLTRFSSLAICIIMIGALTLAHSDWSIFIGERGKVLFSSEQLFLLTLGVYFFILGNNSE